MEHTAESKTSKHREKFSIIIPTWNNLDYLKLCISSIQKNAAHQHQIIVFINEGKDNTLNWIKSQKNIDHIYSEKNVGICIALNKSRKLVRTDYIVYINDDMYCCPDWDKYILDEIQSLNDTQFYLSATLIEPKQLNNPNYVAIINDCGDCLEKFDEQKLLSEYNKTDKQDWNGSSWPPSIVHKNTWDLVGGYSEEFSPGMYSDPDFSMKLWAKGIRIFKGVGKSRVYHFGSKSTKKLKSNIGSKLFLQKWGITARTFYTHYLKMGSNYSGPFLPKISLPITEKIRNKIKRIITK